MIRGQRVAVVIPAYRVEKQIPGVIEKMPACVDRVIVVEDGSPDATADVVAKTGDPRVLLLRHAANQGVGGAMRTGYQKALEEGADLIVKCDGDGQMDPAEIERLVAPLVEDRAEYAKACRFHHFRELHSMPMVRLAGNVALSFLTKLASGYWHVLDPQNGYVAIRADTLRRLPLHRLVRGYFFENDMLIRLNSLQARVADVPLPSRYGDETSSLRPGRVLLEFPFRLIGGFFRRLFWRYVFYDVSPVALFVLFGLRRIRILSSRSRAYARSARVKNVRFWLPPLRRREIADGFLLIRSATSFLVMCCCSRASSNDLRSSPRLLILATSSSKVARDSASANRSSRSLWKMFARLAPVAMDASSYST